MTSHLNQLVVHLMSLEAIPSGGGVADGVAFLLDGAKVRGAAKRAKTQAMELIDGIRRETCRPSWDTEEIARDLMDAITARR